MRLLVTRPEPDGERTAAHLRARGHDVTLAPLLRIEVVPADFGPGPFAAIVMTSAHALRALADHPRRQELIRLAVFTVGRHGAEQARQAGFPAVVSADGNADDLVRLIGARFAGTQIPFLYLAGADRAEDLAAALGRYGLSVHTVIVYRAIARATLPPETSGLVARGALDGVLHYSRRTAEAFIAAAGETGVLAPALAMVHFCLSAEIAALLTTAGARKVKIAARPEEAALMELLSLQ